LYLVLTRSRYSESLAPDFRAIVKAIEAQRVFKYEENCDASGLMFPTPSREFGCEAYTGLGDANRIPRHRIS
jgi:hypothetical protein